MKRLFRELRTQNVLYYILSFSVLVFLIIFIMGIYLYRFYYQTIYSDFQASNAQYLETKAMVHENDLQIINDIVHQMGMAGDNAGFKLSENPQKAINLIKRLHQYKMVSQFFYMPFYFYQKDEYLYNDRTSLSVDYFIDRGCIFEQTGSEEFREVMYSGDGTLRALPEQSVSGYWIGKYMPDARVVVYMQAIPPRFQEVMFFLVEDSYYDSFIGMDEGEMRSVYIIDGEKVIVSRGGLDVEDEVVLGLLRRGTWQDKVQIGKKEYMITAYEGSSGLRYCSLQSMEIFYDKILTEQWGITMLLLVCSIPAALLLVALSRKLVAKMQKLNKMLDLQENNYNIGSIEAGIQMLIASNVQKEEDNQRLKRTQFIRGFVRGDFSDEEEVRKAAQSVSIHIEKIYAIFLMSVRGDSNEKDIHVQMLESIRRREHVDGYGFLLVSSNQSLLVVFADTQESMEDVMDAVFTIGKENSEEFLMAVSGFHTFLTDGSTAYLEAGRAFDNRFLQDNNRILRFTEVVSQEILYILPDIYLQNLRNALKSRDKEAVRKSVEEICWKMQQDKPTLFAFRLTYNRIIHLMLTEWNDRNAETENLYNVFALSQCLTIQDFNDLLCEACHIIIDSSSQEPAEKSDIVQNAMKYMENNFSSPDLTMSVLADYLQVSSVTLSVVFKNSMGIRPSDYLANLRIEQARKLLLTTDMLVREICTAVGYEDDHVFTRRFKKYTGKTPKQYRDANEG